MAKKNIAVLGGVVLVLILTVALRQSASPEPTGQTQGTFASTATRQSISENLPVPGAGATDMPANVAVPSFVGAGAAHSSVSVRIFGVRVENNRFTPEVIRVEQGDTVRIEFTASDREYDVTQPDYGMNLALPRGQTKIMEFGVPLDGRFRFFCKRCGGPEKGPVGYLEVVPQTNP